MGGKKKAATTPRADTGRERQNYFSFGVQYYVAARSSARAKSMPVCGNLFHHAVEMFLKGQLCITHDAEKRKKLGHRLSDVWEAFKAEVKRRPPPAGVNLSEFDGVVRKLDRFERIRYPDRIAEEGMQASLGWQPGPPSRAWNEGPVPPSYDIVVTELDRLIGGIFEACGVNPKFFMNRLNAHAIDILGSDNPVCQGWFDIDE